MAELTDCISGLEAEDEPLGESTVITILLGWGVLRLLSGGDIEESKLMLLRERFELNDFR